MNELEISINELNDDLFYISNDKNLHLIMKLKEDTFKNMINDEIKFINDMHNEIDSLELLAKEYEDDKDRVKAKINLSPLETIAYVYDYVRNRVYNQRI